VRVLVAKGSSQLSETSLQEERSRRVTSQSRRDWSCLCGEGGKEGERRKGRGDERKKEKIFYCITTYKKDKVEEGGTTHKCKRAYRQLREGLVVRQGVPQTAHQFRWQAIKGQRRFVKQYVLADLIDANVD